MGLSAVPGVEWDKSTLLSFEREMLGLYVSDHPLFGVEHVLTAHADTQIAALTADEGGRPEGSMVTVAGLITGLQVKRTKKGDLWAIATVEDLAGSIECLFFPSAYMTVGPLLQQDTVAVVRGKLNRRDDTVSIYAQELTLPDVSEGPRGPVVVTMETARATTQRVEELKAVLTNHPGTTEVHLRLVKPGPVRGDPSRPGLPGQRHRGAVRRPQGAPRPAARLPGGFGRASLPTRTSVPRGRRAAIPGAPAPVDAAATGLGRRHPAPRLSLRPPRPCRHASDGRDRPRPVVTRRSSVTGR